MMDGGSGKLGDFGVIVGVGGCDDDSGDLGI